MTRVDMEDLAELFSHSRAIFDTHVDCNGKIVPLMGVVERLVGIARRSEKGFKQARRGA